MSRAGDITRMLDDEAAKRWEEFQNRTEIQWVLPSLISIPAGARQITQIGVRGPSRQLTWPQNIEPPTQLHRRVAGADGVPRQWPSAFRLEFYRARFEQLHESFAEERAVYVSHWPNAETGHLKRA